VPGLGASLGRGGATTALQDLAKADAILIMGSSMAEAHPVGFRFVVAAREKGATIIHVDPRYARTSAMSTIWAPIRSGSDIVFLGALVRHVLENGRYFEEYVRHYTNAPVILPDDFRDTEDLGGIFSGFDEASGRYDDASWRYDPRRRDPDMKHPRCVLQVLKGHFARYTPALVEDACGIGPELFGRIADALCDNSGPERTSAICYAVGWTQHTTGVQIIRTAAILQLLLGNIGRPGGGIMALRGHASIQGSTDVPTLFNNLPGYVPMPRSGSDKHEQGPADDLISYLEKASLKGGPWHSLDAYLISLLKAWYGDAATPANDFGFGWLPRIDGDHSHFAVVNDMMDGKVDGYFVMGENPAIGSQNGRVQRLACARLKWMVVRDLVMIESATFWKDSPEIDTGELRPEEVETEVFFLPAASHVEKEGTFTQTQRLLQFREKAVEPPGDARSDAWFVYELGKRLKAMAAESDDPKDDGLRALTWEYGHDEPDATRVLEEINGRAGDRLLGSASELRADGSTACGCWIYSGVTPSEGRNRARERNPRGYLGHGWGFAWPADRRILYNRASARPDGAPWSERKKLVWWDARQGRWSGLDQPDFYADKPPDYRPGADAVGADAIAGDAPFIMHDDGLGWLFVPRGLADGPLPTHYEPLETVAANTLYPGRATNPLAKRYPRRENRLAEGIDPRFPYVLTTYRLTEHHTAGGMSRWLSHLAELQPAMFAEISPELAAAHGLTHGEWMTIVTMRSAIEARVLVTRRMRPLRVQGRVIHQIAVPFHFGGSGLVTGDAANDLIPIVSEPNVFIHEGKTLTCTVRPGRRPRGAALRTLLGQLGGP